MSEIDPMQALTDQYPPDTEVLIGGMVMSLGALLDIRTKMQTDPESPCPAAGHTTPEKDAAWVLRGITAYRESQQ